MNIKFMMEFTNSRVAQLDVSKLKGEDVEQAARLIKSMYRVLKSSSTDSRSYVPRDFVKTVMFALQTTTVREFNEVFCDLERKLQVDADMEGVQPKWPSLSKVIGLATNTCRRLKASGVWDGVVSKRSQACNLTRSNLSPSSSSNAKILCWNCGGPHHLDDCPKPVDQASASCV